MESRVYSVTELNCRIKELLNSDRGLLELCVKGELSNYKIYPSGHHYFTLKDSESSLKCVMFKSAASKLRFRPENGMSVTAFGRVTVYERDGLYQLYCTGIMPLGVGDLQVAFEQLKEKLGKEGLFDAEHKKALPAFPKRIAIITSEAGAAVHDMIRILAHRWPMTEAVLLPVRVQGIEAPAEIAGAIRYANEFKVADLIITGRGGGSIEDLWAFNDERVARAIYASEIPVISAVGHEPDVTISDYVADRRASTPSNAAEIAVPDWRDVKAALDTLEHRSIQAIDNKLAALRERLENLQQKRVLTEPSTYIDNRRMELDRISDKLAGAQDRIISEKKRQYIALASALDAMSPLRVLSRGYSAATDSEGRLISSVKALKLGDRFNLRLYDGEADCELKGIKKYEGECCDGCKKAEL